MKLEEIADSAQSMAAQLKAGISAVEGATLMADVQPDYAQFWQEAAKNMAAGRPLSDSLLDLWPESLVAVVRAGEHAGKTDSILLQIEETVRLQIGRQEDFGKLKKPAIIFLVGTCVFLFMLLYVIPHFNESMHTTITADTDPFTAASFALHAWVEPIWMPLCVAIGGGVFVFFNWARTKSGKDAIDDFSLTVPMFGPSIQDFHYAVWARFQATVEASGIPLIEGLALTRGGLPPKLQEGIEKFERELRNDNSAVEVAADEKNWQKTDQRHDWPLYLRRAFIVGSRVGKYDEELRSASALIMKYAQRRFDKAVARAEFIAFVSCGFMAMLSAFALYMPILTSLKNFR